jgi:hypothetical protein
MSQPDNIGLPGIWTYWMPVYGTGNLVAWSGSIVLSASSVTPPMTGLDELGDVSARVRFRVEKRIFAS